MTEYLISCGWVASVLMVTISGYAMGHAAFVKEHLNKDDRANFWLAFALFVLSAGFIVWRTNIALPH